MVIERSLSWQNIPFYQFCDRIFPSSTNFLTQYSLHVPISRRNIPFMYQFRDGIYPSCTNFVTEYSLHLPISWRNIPFIYEFRDGILHFVLASYLSLVSIRFYIYTFMCISSICISYWYNMRILCHCTDIYNNDACHFVYTSWKVLPTLPYLHYFVHPICFFLVWKIFIYDTYHICRYCP